MSRLCPDHPAHRIVTILTELPWLLLVRVWSKAHKIYECSLLWVSDETHNGKVTFTYTYTLDVLTPAVFPSPLLGTF